MNGLNKAFLLGRLGADPEPRAIANGGTLVRLSLATPHAKKVNEEWVESTDWHRVTVFGKDADFLAARARKGDMVGVECQIRPNKWTDAEGKTRYDIDLVSTRIICLQSRVRPSESATASGADSRGDLADRGMEGEEIPF